MSRPPDRVSEGPRPGRPPPELPSESAWSGLVGHLSRVSQTPSPSGRSRGVQQAFEAALHVRRTDVAVVAVGRPGSHNPVERLQLDTGAELVVVALMSGSSALADVQWGRTGRRRGSPVRIPVRVRPVAAVVASVPHTVPARRQESQTFVKGSPENVSRAHCCRRSGPTPATRQTRGGLCCCFEDDFQAAVDRKSP